MKDLDAALKALAQKGVFPNGADAVFLGLKDVRSVAQAFDLHTAEVEIQALSQQIIPLRYARNMHCLSCRDQIRLLQSGAAVVGLGGLGGFAAEILARMGLGRLILIDPDSFEETNLNRQAFCSEETLGQAKVLAAAQRLQAVNSSLRITAHAQPLTADNFQALTKDANIILDCVDNNSARSIIARLALQAELPFVSAAVAGLVAGIRTNGKAALGNNNGHNPSAEDHLGTPAVTPALAAVCQCAEVLAILLDRPASLINRFLAVDLGDMCFETFNLKQ